MKTNIFGFFFLLAFSAIFLLTNPGKVYAASISVTGKAKVLNTNNSYLDFTNYNSNVTVDDGSGNFSGYAFLEDFGWVAFGTTDNSLGPVNLNLTTGAVTGKAKAFNTGAYLDFTNYNSNVSVALATGVFSGYVFSEDAGWINFSDTGVSSASPFLPTAPSGLSGTANSSTAITWGWTDNSSNETGFKLYDNSNNLIATIATVNTESYQETGLTKGTTYTRYVVAYNSVGNSSSSGNASVTTNASKPDSFDLKEPSHESYINNERPTFKWEDSADSDDGMSKYKLEIDNGDSGDFTIDDIPVSRTTDYSTNKYLIHYENFNDSDSTNNYISVYTKSSSDWSTDNNDGKLKEGKRSWKVKAVDNAGNEREESRTLFVDRSGPGVEATQINDTSFADNLATIDKTPAVYGKITDLLAGDKTDNKVASGPKEVEIKFEKRNYLGVYSLYALATVNINELYWSDTGAKITDNAKNTVNKYSNFSYTPTDDLLLGTYKIILTGKDKADNSGGAFSFTLTIKTFEEIAKIPEVEKTIEELEKEGIPKEKIEEVIKEQGVVVPEELKEPSKIAEAIGKVFAGIVDLWWKTVDTGKFIAKEIGQGLAFVAEKTGQASQAMASGLGKTRHWLTLAGNQIKNSAVATTNTIGKATNQFLAFRKQKTEEQQMAIGKLYFNLAQKAPGIIQDGLLAIARSADRVNKAIGDTSNKVTNATGNVASTTGKFIAGRVGTVTGGVKTTVQAIGKTVNQQTSKLATAWRTSRESIGRPATEEAQNLVTRLQIATSAFVAIVFDKEPTRIADIRVEEVSPTTAVVYWRTNHYATSKVNYGFSTGYGKEVSSSKNVKEHRIVLKDLEPGKLYYFEVMSQGKNYVYDAYYTFNTPIAEEGKVKGAATGEKLVTIATDEGSWVVVRNEPSLKGEILAKVAVGQSFPLLEEKDGWVKIKLDGQEGWVFGDLVKIGGGEQE